MGKNNSKFLTPSRPSDEDLGKIEKIFESNSLVLRFKSLTEMPWKEILETTSLERLDLAQNEIKLEFQSKLSMDGLKSLGSLKYLSLSDNQLLEVSEEIGNLTLLEELILSTNHLENLPKSISKLENLKVLDIFLNKIKNVDLKGMESLKKLSAGFNFIKELDVSNNKKLETLDLSSNEFVEFPVGIENCESLKDLRLRFNSLKKVPENFKFKNLVKLNLSFNFLTELPDSFTDLVSLKEVKLFNNLLKKLPKLPPRVELLELQNNCFESFEGIINEGNKSLEKINLSYNNISKIDDSFAFSPLIFIDLSRNKIKTLPDQWPKTLKELYIGSNEITDISKLLIPSLEELYLSGNKIQVLTRNIFEMKRLKSLSIAFNEITKIEDLKQEDLNQVSCLEKLYIGFNKIKEFSNDFFKKHKNIGLLDFSYNEISKLPDEFEEMSFGHLHMNGNLITDDSLERLGEISSMNLYISDNPFKKEIDPDEIDYEEAIFEENQKLASGHAEMCGLRPSFEDQCVLKEKYNNDKHIFAVFDGHGGSLGAKKAAETLLSVYKSFDNENLKTKDVLIKTFQELEKNVCEASFKNVEGTTATVVLIDKDEIYSANLGDSRSVLISKDSVKQISYEHKGFDREEHQRIKSVGGFITENDRVQGIICVPRSLGDKGLKKYLSSDPYISHTKISNDDQYIVIACDGVWDVLNNVEVKNLINPKFDSARNARMIRDCAFALGSSDNISCVVINLKLLLE